MISKNTLLFAIGTLFLLIVTGVLCFFAFTSSSPASPVSSSNALLPISSSKTDTSTRPSTSQAILGTNKTPTFTLRGIVGSMNVVDFRKSTDVASTSDEVFLTWTQSSEEYQAFYLPTNQSFTIVLLKEPIAEIRRKATLDVEAKLGISSKDICGLVAEVIVPFQVNSFYAVKNLGFPNCPGAEKFEGD
ncbi:MAG: hypothetical protein V4437_01170 [Patescibacteria group bacterium]